MVNRVFCFVAEKNGVKYLKIDKVMGNHGDSILSKWNQVFDSIKYHIKKIMNNAKHSPKSILITILIKLNLLVMIVYL